jgi:hypothetical protein
MKSIVTDRTNYLPIGTAALLLLLTSVRGLADEFLSAIGFRGWTMFSPGDQFADLIKAALSYTFITGSLAETKQFATWPDFFKDYLLHNSYNTGLLTNLHAPPVSQIILLAAAVMIVAIGPMLTYLSFVAGYAGGAALVARFLATATKATAVDALACFFILILSYPALYMLDRGNFASGFTSLLICTYAISVRAGNARWLGWLCLALAIGMRPNTAIFLLIEFAGSQDLRSAILRLLCAILISIAVLAASYFIVNHFYPEFTISGFLRGLEIYGRMYIVGEWGDAWNSSLYGAVKNIRHRLTMEPYYSPPATILVTILGCSLFAPVLYLIVRRKFSVTELTFISAAFGALFTPVFGLYHMLEFAPVLLLIFADARDGQMASDKERWPILLATILVLCPVGGSVTNGILYAGVLIAGGTLVSYRAYRRNLNHCDDGSALHLAPIMPSTSVSKTVEPVRVNV